MTDVYKGATDQSFNFELVNSTTGLPATGITYTQITAAYVRTRSLKVDITPATLASPSGTHSDGGFVAIDNTTNPGIYRLDIPDAAFATGAYDVAVTIVPSGCRSVTRNFDLVDINNQVAYVPNVAAGATSGVLTVNTMSDLAQGIPPATPTIEEAIMYLYSALRNKGVADSTANEKQFYNDSGVLIWKKGITKTATSYTEAEGASGP